MLVTLLTRSRSASVVVNRLLAQPTRRTVSSFTQTNKSSFTGAATRLQQQQQVAPQGCAAWGLSGSRQMSTEADDKAMREKLNNFQDLFVEARLCIEDVQDSKGSVYFDEDAEAAKAATEEAIAAYDSMLESFGKEKREEIQRGNGLKVAQLRAELELALEVHDH
jgi:hypothetical protein